MQKIIRTYIDAILLALRLQIKFVTLQCLSSVNDNITCRRLANILFRKTGHFHGSKEFAMCLRLGCIFPNMQYRGVGCCYP